MRKITSKVLKRWGACAEGAAWFNKRFPKGATLKTASSAAIKKGWSDWLWRRCSGDALFFEQTVVFANAGEALAGREGKAIAGDCSNATAGDGGVALAGYKGTANVGDFGTAKAGVEGTAVAGDTGRALACNYGVATAGDFGVAIAGTDGSATAKEGGLAKADGAGGKARAGLGGCIVLTRANGTLACAEVDGKRIKADVFYRLNDKDKFVEVK